MRTTITSISCRQFFIIIIFIIYTKSSDCQRHFTQFRDGVLAGGGGKSDTVAGSLVDMES
jgi:hypothetical protein